jgi:hypothetical protein
VAFAIMALLVVAAPAAIGAAMIPLARELGGQQDHLCKCGMRPGRCGCPECARLERERLREREPESALALKSHCDDDATAFAIAQMQSTLPPSRTATLPAAPGEPAATITRVPPIARPIDAPPTPPPRSVPV